MKRSDLYLLKQLVKRDVFSRYKGSFLGILWSFIIPILMLVVYTFVFSVVFKGRWSVESNNHLEFALIIFSGITVFNFFSEVINRSPSLIIGNSNYVKKIVFPLELLSISALLTALIHALISLFILFVGLVFFGDGIHFSAIYLPLVCLPITLMTLGASWFLASLGVYVRDISHIISVFTSALMFLSPIFYSVNTVPVELRFIYNINPIAHTVEDMRKIIIWGQLPDFTWILIGTGIGLLMVVSGFYWLKKTRGGFADVL
ncbi:MULTISPECIES: ABC transporter permease [unclassified Paenibacillus]|uniref:ABC transporter permease n=1 Tax=unclassified Paenibacillus TaxID=185978 RepID=UPI0004051795|nr:MULTISPECIES: ABC transporter permease [unclassified Paenibacillus]KGP80830.1 sugar ABC transporter permease [Paenibacillus sp. MAEPY2]KGP88068.1 sugar ABC transporter permease [Paenibacillus sp. MAEPY1]